MSEYLTEKKLFQTKLNNAAIHQKSLSFIVQSFSKIIQEIIEQGMNEGSFVCKYPQQMSEFIVCILSFLLDDELFNWSNEDKYNKLIALTDLIETYLQCPQGTFSFMLE